MATLPFKSHLGAHSWTKECGGQYRQYLSVSTWEKAVVRDGIPYDDWCDCPQIKYI
jgi:hypothetical protein